MLFSFNSVRFSLLLLASAWAVQPSEAAEEAAPATTTMLRGNSPNNNAVVQSVHHDAHARMLTTHLTIDDLFDKAFENPTNRCVDEHYTPAGALVNDQIIKPGVHCYGALNIIAGATIYLDAENDANAIFIFLSETTLTTGAGVDVVLDNGAVAGNVLFVTRTAVTTGASTIIPGSILAGAAITLGASSEVNSALAGAAISPGAGANTTVSGETDIAVIKNAIYDLLGKAESTATPTAESLEIALGYCNEAVVLTGALETHLPITPGVYCFNILTITAGQNITLNVRGIYIFVSDSYITTGAAANVNLGPDVNPEDVLFVSKHATTTGAASIIRGTILAGAAITLGAESEVTYGLSGAATTLGAGAVLFPAQLNNDDTKELVSALLNPTRAVNLGDAGGDFVVLGTNNSTATYQSTRLHLDEARQDIQNAYDDALGRTADPSNTNLTSASLDGTSATNLTAGVYHFIYNGNSTSAVFDMDIHFDGSATDVFIIQIIGNAEFGDLGGSSTTMFLTGGALENNIFWVVTDDVAIVAGAHVKGNILANGDVIISSTSELTGRILSLGAVTDNGATINW
jgi:hypothetical protein